MMDMSIGHSDDLHNVMMPESESDFGEGVIRRVYNDSETHCIVYVEIDKSTRNITSWGYLGYSGNCYLKTNWLGPW